jgi:ABC-2 type transport system permease protein
MSVLDIPAQPRTWLGRLRWTVRDGWTVTRREFGHIRYEPGQLAGALIFPAVMVVLFGYVFGSAIEVPGGGSYREYLMPGLFAMTAVIGLLPSALMVSKDVAEGVVDRFRSMPMARSAVPFGRTLADLLTGTIGLAIMASIGLLVGWRARDGIASAAAAFGLVTLLRYALSWGGVFMGLSLRPETVDAFVPLVFPITMISNSFVPTTGMPEWLRTIADWNPVSALVAACRQLFGNPGAAAAHASWPLQHPITATIGWSLLLLAVFVPLATIRYQAGNRGSRR